ncbi:bifunctional acetaldehyde-CoA/alcohol dehydrogenase, partial [Streptomyces sp. NPDC054837]
MAGKDDGRPTTPDNGPSETAIAVDRLVTNGLKALADYESLTQEQVDHIVKKASVAALDRHTGLAALAVEETGRGVFEDKAAKNMFACEHVTHSMGRMKTVGVIARDDIEDIVEIAEPVGVVCGI